MRVRDSDDARFLAENARTLSEVFARFAHLETIVLETGRQLVIGNVEPLLEALRTGSGADVQHRTCDDGLRLALGVKMGTDEDADAGLLSPFWCLKTHVRIWEHWWVSVT